MEPWFHDIFFLLLFSYLTVGILGDLYWVRTPDESLVLVLCVLLGFTGYGMDGQEPPLGVAVHRGTSVPRHYRVSNPI